MLTGPERRRRWADETKIAVVREALADGAVVSDVARRHDITPSQLFGWMRQLRTEVMGRLAPPQRLEVPSPMFAPAVVDVAPVIPPPAVVPAEPPAAIEISVGAATVRISGAVDGRTLAAVLKALRALA